MKTAKMLTALALLGALTTAVQTQQAQAQTWQPTRQIKAIVPFPAGGGTDLMGRLVAKGLSDRLGQQVYVENRGGANGAIGVQAVQNADPDGYTIGVISDGPAIVNTVMYSKNPYHPLRDLVPVAMVNRFPSMIVANPGVGIKDVKGMIAYAKANPGKLNYSSGGIGNFSHMGLELLAQQTGINIVHVPYKGIGPATQALLTGEVQLTYNNVATALPHVKAGKMTAVAIGEAKRLPGLDVPTISETVPGFEFSAWIGIFAPAKTPKPVVDRLAKEIQAFLNDPATKDYFTKQYINASYKAPDEFTAFVKSELTKWEVVIAKAGLKQ
jgi:tripartite-type tricarboxylate transporter receptor subunit TctC